MAMTLNNTFWLTVKKKTKKTRTFMDILYLSIILYATAL